MTISTIILTVLGLCLFEVVNSIDNAVINADVIQTVSPRARRWFLSWGLLFAVFGVRGLLPWAIIWATDPKLGAWGAMTASFSKNPAITHAIQSAAPILLIGSGTFLILLFTNWLLVEPKDFGLPGERYFSTKSVWFYATASIVLAITVWLAVNTNPVMAVGAVIGSSAFFVIHGLRQIAEHDETDLLKSNNHRSDVNKIIYLEILDASFSLDGVLGAFAFTLSVPLIIIGNGLGALVTRQLTVGNIDNIQKYIFLKNGAMYSVLVLGLIMILDSFGLAIPDWAAPISTFIIVGYFFWRSRHHRKTRLN